MLEALALGAKWYTWKGENVKMFIRMGITVSQIVICGGELSVLWSPNAFYGSAGASPLMEISNHKTDDLAPQMSILSTVIYLLLLTMIKKTKKKKKRQFFEKCGNAMCGPCRS